MAQKLAPKYNNAGDYTLKAKDKKDEISMDFDPFLLFKNAIRSEQTKRKYQERLKTFFDFFGIDIYQLLYYLSNGKIWYIDPLRANKILQINIKIC